MTIIYDAKLPNCPVEARPDSYDEILGIVPPADFVVSRNRDGSIASRYADLSWNFTAYHPEGRSSWLHFAHWRKGDASQARLDLANESRWLIFLLLWKRQGPAYSFMTTNHLLAVVRGIATFAETKGCRIQDVLTDATLLGQCMDSLSACRKRSFPPLLSTLWQLGASEVGYNVTGGATFLKKVRAATKEYTSSFKQHPPIPTRIYQNILTGLTSEIEEFESIIDPFLRMVTTCAEDPLVGRRRSIQWRVAKEKRLNRPRGKYLADFDELLDEYGLRDYFSRKGLPNNIQGLAGGLARVQTAIKLQVQAFTGMRDDEAETLPYYCQDTSVSSGITHHLILGRTTKFNKGKIKRTRWVTSRETYRAIGIAQRIADVIYSAIGAKPKQLEARVNETPLFISTAYLPFCTGVPNDDQGVLLPQNLGLSLYSQLREGLLSAIEEEDLLELERIDPHRAWRSEERFQLGHVWRLTSHQLRRSLALYAQRSGLVSLPSLRRQLQHITDEMSRYYARGSAFARDFIGDDPQHFGLEWQRSQSVSSALSYIFNVLLSDEVLFGGHAEWVDNRLRDPDGIISVDREKTLERFRRGELAYRETILGGCTKVGECEDVAITWLDIDCLKGCPNMVVRLPNLERVIIAQTHLVGSLAPGTLEFRSEQADLNVLIAVRDKVLLKLEQNVEAAL